MKTNIYLAIVILLSCTSLARRDQIKESLDSTISWMKTNVGASVENFHSSAFQVLSRANAIGDLRNIAQVHTFLFNSHEWNGYFPYNQILYRDEKTES